MAIIDDALGMGQPVASTFDGTEGVTWAINFGLWFCVAQGKPWVGPCAFPLVIDSLRCGGGFIGWWFTGDIHIVGEGHIADSRLLKDAAHTIAIVLSASFG